MTFRFACLLSVSVAFVACNVASDRADGKSRRVGDSAGIRASYVWGAEVNTMRPCGTDSTFWVLASTAVLKRLRASQESLQSKPYDAIFIRVLGKRTTGPTDGFAEQTNGYFQVTQLFEVRRLQPGEC